VTNGSFGAKDAVSYLTSYLSPNKIIFNPSQLLVFRSNLLSESPSQVYDHPDLYSESPSTSSTCAELSKLGYEKSSASSLVESSATEHESVFSAYEKKLKKKSFESSLSTSSCSSSSNNPNEINTKSDSNDESGTKFDNENKENIVAQIIDKDEMPSAIFNITFKFLNTETRLLRKILIRHGMTEAAHDATDYNLLWTGNVLKPDMLRGLSSYQRINHFPR
jgi:hypothetical protein